MLLVFPEASCLREQSHPLWGHLGKSLSTGDGFSRRGFSLHNSGGRKEKILFFTHSGTWSGRGWRRPCPSSLADYFIQALCRGCCPQGGREGGTQALCKLCLQIQADPMLVKRRDRSRGRRPGYKGGFYASWVSRVTPNPHSEPRLYSLDQAFAVCLLCTRHYAVEMQRVIPRSWQDGSSGKDAAKPNSLGLISGTPVVYGED